MIGAAVLDTLIGIIGLAAVIVGPWWLITHVRDRRAARSSS